MSDSTTRLSVRLPFDRLRVSELAELHAEVSPKSERSTERSTELTPKSHAEVSSNVKMCYCVATARII